MIHLGLALALATGLGAGSALGQATIDVGGAGVIGDSTLTTTAGIALFPESGDNWSTNGGTGAPVSSTLASPAVAVPATGNVILTFTHRYDFESGWDGGAIVVSVNNVPVYLDGAAFSSNGYVGTTTANTSNAWAGGESVFYGQSAGYSTSAMVMSVANLGELNAGDTVSIAFKGEWDEGQVNGPPAWEIGTVKLTDTGATDFLDVDFTADGPSGFTVASSGSLPGPWTYLSPVSRFELDANTNTADRYKPDIAGSEIDLYGAKIEVVLLNGTLESGDTFSLFDLTGGTTLTGSVTSISLPPWGIWDTSNLGVNGTITLTTVTVTNGTWTADAAGNWSDTTKWLDTKVANGPGFAADFALSLTGDRIVTLDSGVTIGTIIKNDTTDSTTALAKILTIAGPGTLTLDSTIGSPVLTNSDPSFSQARFEISAPISSSDGLTKNGTGLVRLLGNTSSYTGATSISGGMLDFGGIPNTNIGGGSGRNITVAAGGTVRFNALSNTFLNRLVETTDEICVMTGTTANNLDLSGSTGATLPGAFISNWASNGGKTELSGTITPAGGAYRLAYPGQAGALGIRQECLLSGSNGLIVGGNRVVIVGAHTFTGDTVIRNGGRLGLAAFTGGTNSLGLQNSILDTGIVGDTGQVFLEAGSVAGPITGSNLGSPASSALGTLSATFGGLKGSRNLQSIFVVGNTGNNTSGTALANIVGFTLNVGSGNTPLYSGNIANFAAGTTITKTGPGTQTLSGANTYTGATSVNEGTLALVGGSQTSPITIAGGASLGFTLGSPTTSTSSVAMGTGTVKITGTVDNASDYLLMTANLGITGTLTLAPDITNYDLELQDGGKQLWLVYSGGGSLYGGWSGGAAADIDTNGDGISNGVAWALGAANPNANAIGLLPTLDNTSDPTYVIFTFDRSDLADADPNTDITVQYGSNLVGWTPAVDDDDNVDIIVNTGSPTDEVIVKLKRSTLEAGGKLFARLNVVVIP